MLPENKREINENNLQKLASTRVDQFLSEYPGTISGNEVLIVAIGARKIVTELSGLGAQDSTQFVSIALDFLRQFETNQNNNSRINKRFEAGLNLSSVSRTALVGLAAAAIGASSGLIGQKLNPILVGIVGAESAVVLNVLATFLTNAKDRENNIDGLDLAIFSVLKEGHYTVNEVRVRISENLDIDEVRSSIDKLVRFKKVKTGQWEQTYTAKVHD